MLNFKPELFTLNSDYISSAFPLIKLWGLFNLTHFKSTFHSSLSESYLSTVLRDELIFLDRLFDEDAPACHIWRGQQQVLRDRGRESLKTSEFGVWVEDFHVFKDRVSPSWLLSGWSSSCRTRSCCPSGLQRRRSGRGRGHTPSLPGSRDTAWCCTELCSDNLGNGSDLHPQSRK